MKKKTAVLEVLATAFLIAGPSDAVQLINGRVTGPALQLSVGALGSNGSTGAPTLDLGMPTPLISLSLSPTGTPQIAASVVSRRLAEISDAATPLLQKLQTPNLQGESASAAARDALAPIVGRDAAASDSVMAAPVATPAAEGQETLEEKPLRRIFHDITKTQALEIQRQLGGGTPGIAELNLDDPEQRSWLAPIQDSLEEGDRWPYFDKDPFSDALYWGALDVVIKMSSLEIAAQARDGRRLSSTVEEMRQLAPILRLYVNNTALSNFQAALTRATEKLLTLAATKSGDIDR